MATTPLRRHLTTATKRIIRRRIIRSPPSNHHPIHPTRRRNNIMIMSIMITITAIIINIALVVLLLQTSPKMPSQVTSARHHHRHWRLGLPSLPNHQTPPRSLMMTLSIALAMMTIIQMLLPSSFLDDPPSSRNSLTSNLRLILGSYRILIMATPLLPVLQGLMPKLKK